MSAAALSILFLTTYFSTSLSVRGYSLNGGRARVGEVLIIAFSVAIRLHVAVKETCTLEGCLERGNLQRGVASFGQEDAPLIPA